ncbi:type A chloramphenicol O-acetyltransferase [Bacillus xiapuensis]|uniref:type A chloramphenicol O-acetyltransferase n=1 Tax=Bacillus xiapuensis TaxID=2014075 RepID=UPI000C24ACF8|nr:type A chloramphenicol O-acetyltransferase [Bacillus xiapuensis]
MKFHAIDLDNWDRKAYFEHFLTHTRCTFSMTAIIEITELLAKLREKGIKLYPAFIYMVTNIVNSRKEFRTCFDEEGRLGYWDEMTPSFTIFHNDNQTFSNLWTEYSADFHSFYKSYLEDMKLYGDAKEMNPKKFAPKNTFPVSCIPWTSFTGFNLNIYNGGTYLLPIITSGKYFKQGDKILLPISVQVHHAVCDGYHASQLFDGLQRLADRCEEWLSIMEQK